MASRPAAFASSPRFVPGIGEAFGLRAGRACLAFLERVERAAAPTGIVLALDAIWILCDRLDRSGASHSESGRGIGAGLASVRCWRAAITCFVPWVGEAFSIRPSGRFLTLLQRVERTPTPTGIVFALDAIWILRGSLGRTRSRQSKSTDSQQRQQDPAHHPLTPSAR